MARFYFSDTFTRSDSDTLGTGWTEQSGDWDIVSNVAASQQVTTNIATADNSNDLHGNYRITGRVKVTSSVAGVGFVWRYTDTNNYYSAWINTFVQEVRVYKKVSGTDTQLGSYSGGYSTGTTYGLEIWHFNNTIYVYVSNVLRISITDTAIAGSSSQLGGIWADNSVCTIDNFAINGLSDYPDLVKPVFGQFVPVLEPSEGTFTHNQVQGVFGEFKPVFDGLQGSSGTDVTVSPGVITQSFSLPSPTITTVRNVTVSPDVITRSFSVPTPTVTTIRNVTVSPSVISRTFSLPSPTVTTVKNVTVTPSVVMSTFSIPAPTVSTAGSVTVNADTVTGTFSIPNPTITAIQNVTVTPDAIARTFSMPSVTISVGDGVTPAVLTSSFSIPEPTVTTVRNVTVTPNVVSGTFSIQSPTVVISDSVSPSVITSTFSIPAPSVSTTQNPTISPTTITRVFSIPAPTVSTVRNVTVSPSVITRSFSIPTPSLSVEGGYKLNRVFYLNIGGGLSIPIGPPRTPTWTTESRPAGKRGEMGYNTSLGQYEEYDGSQWVKVAMTAV